MRFVALVKDFNELDVFLPDGTRYIQKFNILDRMLDSCSTEIEVQQLSDIPPWCAESAPKSSAGQWFRDSGYCWWHASAFQSIDGLPTMPMEWWINELFSYPAEIITDDEAFISEDS